MKLTRTGLTLLAAGVAALAVVSVVSAHARSKSSTPAKGEVLAASPAQVSVVFTQAIQKVSGTYSVTVEKDGGTGVTAGPTVIDSNDRTHMSVPLQGGLPPGRYVVHWTNVSDEDGDPAEGAFSFYVQQRPNARDVANDNQLESVGLESETPAAGDTPAAAATGSGATAAAPTRPTATPAVASKSSDGGGNTTLYVVIGLVVVTALAAGGFAYARRGRSGR